MKAGRNLPRLQQTLAEHGKLEGAMGVTRCGMEGERLWPPGGRDGPGERLLFSPHRAGKGSGLTWRSITADSATSGRPSPCGSASPSPRAGWRSWTPRLARTPGVLGCVLLSTCNRTELYCSCEGERWPDGPALLCRAAGVEEGPLPGGVPDPHRDSGRPPHSGGGRRAALPHLGGGPDSLPGPGGPDPGPPGGGCGQRAGDPLPHRRLGGQGAENQGASDGGVPLGGRPGGGGAPGADGNRYTYRPWSSATGRWGALRPACCGRPGAP